MFNMIKATVRSVLNRMGYQVTRRPAEEPAAAPADRYDPDMEPAFRAMAEKCWPFTMTSCLRMYALYNAARYVARNGIPGEFVECGVWRGGSSMLAALTLMAEGDTGRGLYLYDTFEGMSEPSEKDGKFEPLDVRAKWESLHKGSHNDWCYSPLQEVRRNVLSTGYPDGRLHFVKGKVEDTLPGTIPERVAILRLDTDFFESTYHELTHLYPRLVPGGVLILDDYGTWCGAKEAVDRYFREQNLVMLLNKIDKPGRIGMKLS
jgi:hypothetical protein